MPFLVSYTQIPVKSNSRGIELRLNERRIQNMAWCHLYTVHLKKGVDEKLPQSPISPHTPPPSFPSKTAYNFHLTFFIWTSCTYDLFSLCFTDSHKYQCGSSITFFAVSSGSWVWGQKIFEDWSLNLGCEHTKTGVSYSFSPS